MPLPQEIGDVLSGIGLPAGAVAIAFGLVSGAKALERDATDRALQYVSSLLTSGRVADFGKVGAVLITAVFGRVFGSKPFSYKFISCSLLITTIFWLILLLAKHANWSYVATNLGEDWNYYLALIPISYTLALTERGSPTQRISADWSALEPRRVSAAAQLLRQAVSTGASSP